MNKGDLIAGEVQQVSREVKRSKKGQPYTGVKVGDSWFQVWGTHTGLHVGDHLELTVNWVAPENGPAFCTMAGNGKKPAVQHAEPRSMDERVKDLEERVHQCEVMLRAMGAKDVPEDLPF